MKIKISEYIQKISPYVPGKTEEELEQEMGISTSIKMASNENSWGASQKAIRAMRSVLSSQHRYPDAASGKLRNALSQKTGLSIDEIVIGNGSSEIIELLVKTFVSEEDEVISSRPSFSLYSQFVQARGGNNFVVELRNFKHDLESIVYCVTEKTKLIILDNPNNPTGSPINPGKLYSFLSELPESVIVILDEAYVDFMDEEYQIDIFSLIRNCTGRCGVVVLRTFSKLYGLAGLRVGYGLMSAEISEHIHRIRIPFNVNLMGQVGALAALEDENYYMNLLTLVRQERKKLLAGIEKIGLKVCSSQANFFMIDLGKDVTRLYESMLKEGIIVRPLHSFGLPECIRVTVCTEQENNKFLDVFSHCIKKEKYV